MRRTRLISRFQILFNFMISSDGSLKRKVYRSSVWVFTLRIITRVMEVIRLFILTHLLSPGDFGLMGVALLSLSALDSFSQLGIFQALIHKAGNAEKYFNSAWTLQIIRGVSVSLLLFMSSHFIGAYFNEADAIPLIKALALAELIKSFIHVGVVDFQKELNFKAQTVYEGMGVFSDVIISIAAAITLRSPWALIYGLIGGILVRLIFSHYYNKKRLNLELNASLLKDLISFGKYMFLQSSLVFLILNLDDVFVGKYFGVILLGFYQISFKISNMTTTEITHVVSLVTFPAFSKIQNDLNKLGKGLIDTISLTSLISLPIATGLAIMAPEIVNIFLGSEWSDTIPLIQILAAYGLVRSINASYGPMYQATNNLKALSAILLIQLIAMIIMLVPLSNWYGILGVAVAVTASQLLTLILSTIKTFSILKIKTAKIINPIMCNVFRTFLMALVVILLKNSSLYTPEIIHIIMLVLVGAIFYLIISWKKLLRYINYI